MGKNGTQWFLNVDVCFRRIQNGVFANDGFNGRIEVNDLANDFTPTDAAIVEDILDQPIEAFGGRSNAIDTFLTPVIQPITTFKGENLRKAAHGAKRRAQVM